MAAAAGDDARAGSGGKTEIRTERLHDLQVLLGDADLRHLLHIAGGGLEDAAVLGDELLGFLPAGIRPDSSPRKPSGRPWSKRPSPPVRTPGASIPFWPRAGATTGTLISPFGGMGSWSLSGRLPGLPSSTFSAVGLGFLPLGSHKIFPPFKGIRL